MRYWVDYPMEQWIVVTYDRHHTHPWCVSVGDLRIIRARYTTEEEARALVARIHAAFHHDDEAA